MTTKVFSEKLRQIASTINNHRMNKIASIDLSKPLYHGTCHVYTKPKLNAHKILWLTFSPKVALRYATPHWYEGDAYVYEIYLKPNTRIIDLADIKHPAIKELHKDLNQFFFRLGPVSENDWPSVADFGILESQAWVPGFLRERRIDGVIASDKLGQTDIRHQSLALFNIKAIQSIEKQTIPSKDIKRNQTMEEIEKDIHTED